MEGEMKYCLDRHDIPGVEALFAAGFSPNTPLPYMPYLPLTFAIHKGIYEAVDICLHYQADPNKADGFRRLPLFYACREGHARAVRQILYGKYPLATTLNLLAPVNKKAGNRWNGLHYAANYGHTQVIEELLKHPTQGHQMVNKPSKSGELPIHLACKNGHADCVRLIARHGSRLDQRCHGIAGPGTWTALHLAAMGGHAEAGAALFESALDRSPKEAENLIFALEKSNLKPKRSAIKLARDFGHNDFVTAMLRKRDQIEAAVKAEANRQAMKSHHADRFSRMSRGERSAGGGSRRKSRNGNGTGELKTSRGGSEESSKTSYAIPSEAAPYLEHQKRQERHKETKK